MPFIFGHNGVNFAVPSTDAALERRYPETTAELQALRAENEQLRIERDAGLEVIELAREYAKSGLDAALSAQIAGYDDIVQSVRHPRVWQR